MPRSLQLKLLSQASKWRKWDSLTFIKCVTLGFVLEIERKAIHSRMWNWVRLQNSISSILVLNINQLPSQIRETGNTLETRGLTYSYTFLIKPKNTLISSAKVIIFFWTSKCLEQFLRDFINIRIKQEKAARQSETNWIASLLIVDFPFPVSVDMSGCRYVVPL